MLRQFGEATERNAACDEESSFVKLTNSVVLHGITVTHWTQFHITTELIHLWRKDNLSYITTDSYSINQIQAVQLSVI